MSSKPLLVIVTGEPVGVVRERHGDFPAFFAKALGPQWTDGIDVLDARHEDLRERRFDDCAGIIVTGSPSSVTERAPWMLGAEAALRSIVEQEIPLLGVCFGHQLLASALDGEVRRNPAGRKLGTHTVHVRRADDALFAGLPEVFAANISHEDHVAIRPTRGAIEHLASADHDGFHAFRAGRRAWGVQFHPEFSRDITEGYVHARRALLAQSGLDPERILATLEETPSGPKLLHNFVSVVRAAHGLLP